MAADAAGGVYFCRHAESTFNARGDNSPDVPLSEAGEAQAKRLSGHFHLVLCSPMRRAQQTLRLSGITYERLETLHELREQLNEGCDLLADESDDLLGESEAQLRDRCRRAKERVDAELLSAKAAGFRVLLVSHLFTGWCLLAEFGRGRTELHNARIVRVC